MKLKHFVPILILALVSVVFISGCTSQEEYCGDMNLTEAKQIALVSECGQQGALKDTYMCNQDTGTWWIDLNIEKEGCSPACVVNVATKRAEINWRCTGVESKECVINEDCTVFGKTGDCNSGCFSRNHTWESGGECFRSAPVDCKCVDGKCEGIFEGEMSFEEARQIAEQSECIEEGNLTEGGYFVCADTCSWWIKMDVVREGCNMVCAVDTIEKTAEINWRCTG